MGFGRKRMAIEFRDNVGDDDTRCSSAAMPAGRLTAVPSSIKVTKLRAPVARTVSGSFERGQT